MVLNGHTGNNALIDLITRDIRRERGIIVPWINIWPTGILANQQAHGDNAPRSTGHGSDPIGSVYEYYYPELTRREMAQPPEPAKTVLGLPTNGLTGIKLGNVPSARRSTCWTIATPPSAATPRWPTPTSGKIFADFIIDTASQTRRAHEDRDGAPTHRALARRIPASRRIDERVRGRPVRTHLRVRRQPPRIRLEPGDALLADPALHLHRSPEERRGLRPGTAAHSPATQPHAVVPHGKHRRHAGPQSRHRLPDAGAIPSTRTVAVPSPPIASTVPRSKFACPRKEATNKFPGRL